MPRNQKPESLTARGWVPFRNTVAYFRDPIITGTLIAGALLPFPGLMGLMTVLSGCTTPSQPPGELQKRTVRLTVSEGVIDIAPLFDPDSSAGPVLLFLDPVLYDPGVLVEHPNGPAAWFARQGFRVAVARNLSPDGQAFENTPSTIEATLGSLSNARPTFLIATSPGGQPALSFLMERPDSARRLLNGVVFMGTGFNYSNPKSGDLTSRYPALPGSDLRNACTPGQNCYPFVTPEIEKRGFRFRRFPRLLPGPPADRRMTLPIPVAIVVGETDLLSPPETVLLPGFGLVEDKACPEDSKCPLFLRARKGPGFSKNYDGFDLVSDDAAPDEIFIRIKDWVDRQAKSGPRSVSRR